jgi:hypothetical protein
VKKKKVPQRLGVPQVAARFVAATGSPYSNEEAQIYGPELLRIATLYKVADVRSLAPEQVYAVVEKEPENPLRSPLRFHVDDKEEARAHRIDRAAHLIRSIQVVVTVGKLQVPRRKFVSAVAPVKQGDKVLHRSRHVLREDALQNDPVFRSAIFKQVRNIQNALIQLERFTSEREATPEITLLRDSCRRAFDIYEAAVDKAAE